MTDKNIKKNRRKIRIKHRISRGNASRPRLIVYRSNLNIYVQVVDDEKRITIIGLDTRALKDKAKLNKTDQAKKLGQELAKKLKEKKIEKVVFDRNGYLYHGRVKMICETIREEGIIV